MPERMRYVPFQHIDERAADERAPHVRAALASSRWIVDEALALQHAEAMGTAFKRLRAWWKAQGLTRPEGTIVEDAARRLRGAMVKLDRLEQATTAAAGSDGWMSLAPTECDLCPRRARFRHESGALRCGRCPRPPK